MSLERKIFAGLCFFFLCTLIAPFIYGLILTPPGTIFLGTVHFPQDYLYYLSHITQGREHILLTSYLSTTESMPDLFIGWFYVLLGKIGYLLHISPIYMYQIGLIFCGGLYLTSVYYLVRLMFPQKSTSRILTFLFFMFCNTLPRIVFENGQRILAPYFSWYNYGEPFLRFESVPTHLLIFASIFLVIIVYVTYEKSNHRKTKIILLSIAGICGVSLGSMQPVQWFLIVGTLSVFTFFWNIKKLSYRLLLDKLPLVLFTLTGAPFVLYLKFILDREPFQSASLWEAAQSPTLSLQQMIQYYGIIFVLAFLGIPFLLKQKKEIVYVVGSITIVGLLIFFLPFSKQLPVLTFRYLSPLNVLLYAAGAAEAFQRIPSFFPKITPLIKSIGLTIVFFLLVPLFFIQLNYKLMFATDNAQYYLPESVYNSFIHARDISDRHDTFLIYWPYETIFPAIAGRKEFFTTQYSTINFEGKNKQAYEFLINNMSDTDKKNFLKNNGITYIIANNTQFLSGYSFLKEIEKNSLITTYKVLYEGK